MLSLLYRCMGDRALTYVKKKKICLLGFITYIVVGLSIGKSYSIWINLDGNTNKCGSVFVIEIPKQEVTDLKINIRRYEITEKV